MALIVLAAVERIATLVAGPLIRHGVGMAVTTSKEMVQVSSDKAKVGGQQAL